MFQQTIIIFGSIFGLFVLYFVGRYVIASVSPKTDEKIELHFILKDINRYYSFLLEKGFKIRSAEYTAKFNGNWVVQFESKYCIIHIVQDRCNIEISFTPTLGSKLPKSYTGFAEMVFTVTQSEAHFSEFKNYLHWKKKQQFGKTASLLHENIDQILQYFKDNFNENLSESHVENKHVAVFE